MQRADDVVGGALVCVHRATSSRDLNTNAVTVDLVVAGAQVDHPFPIPGGRGARRPWHLVSAVRTQLTNCDLGSVTKFAVRQAHRKDPP